MGPTVDVIATIRVTISCCAIRPVRLPPVLALVSVNGPPEEFRWWGFGF